jgi:copper chaperone
MGYIVTVEERTEMDTAVYVVPGMSCSHCEAAVAEEISALPGVEGVAVDLETKRVEVSGTALDDAAIRAAIEEAGYEAA